MFVGAVFSRILKKLRDVPFVVSVCSFAFFWLCVCVCRLVSCRVWGPEHAYLLAFLESSLGEPQEHAYLLAFLESSLGGPQEHAYLLAFLESSLGGPQEHAYLLAFLSCRVVSCRVELCRVVSCRFLLLIFAASDLKIKRASRSFVGQVSKCRF